MSTSYLRSYKGSSQCVIDTNRNTAAIAWGANSDSSAVSSLLTSGVSSIASTGTAFAALKNDGSVVTWGSIYNGGDSSAVAGQLASGVVAIASTSAAFAALKSDGSVVTWGYGAFGGNSFNVRNSIQSGVVSIAATFGAFAALKSDGSVVMWGMTNMGGIIGYVYGGQYYDDSTKRAKLSSGVVSIASNDNAFAALKSDGSVVTWGMNAGGGDSSAVASQLSSGVTAISSTRFAFAALKSNGSVVTWGDSAFGGDSSSLTLGQLSSGVTKVVGSDAAFAAVKSSGALVAWGNSANGGSTAAVAGNVATNVIDVVACADGFTAIKTGGNTVTWGGGRAPVTNDGVLSVTASSGSFAFRKLNSVLTWGSPTTGSDTSAVYSQLSGVSSIVATSNAFAALKSNGSVVVWGNPSFGGTGSTTTVASQLGSRIIAISANQGAFVALREVYSVTYAGTNATGGAVPVDSTVYTGSSAATILGAGTMSRAGFSFSGWNTAANGSGTTYTAGQQITPTTNMTLYPIWIEQKYSITYNGNSNTSGSAPTDSSTYNIATRATIAGAGTLVRTGYIFTGWNTAANGSGTSYIAGDQINLTTNLTLYATWGTIKTLTYIANGASMGNEPAPPTTYNPNTQVTILGEGTLVGSGGPFLSWNTAANGTGTTYLPGTIVTMSADLTLYAIYASASAPIVSISAVQSQDGGVTISNTVSNMMGAESYKLIYSPNNADVVASTVTNLVGNASEQPITGTYSLTGLTNDTPIFFKLVAYDGFGAIATSAIQVAVPTETPVSPSFEAGTVTVVTSSDDFELTWPRAIQGSSSLTAINIYRNSQLVTTLPPSAKTYGGSEVAGSYTYTVEAVDAVGNTAALSASVIVKSNVPYFSGTPSIDIDGPNYTINWPLVKEGINSVSSVKVYKVTPASIPPSYEELQTAYLTGDLLATLSKTATSFSGIMAGTGIKYFSIVATDSSGQVANLSLGGVFVETPPAFSPGSLVVSVSGPDYVLVWPSAVQKTYPLNYINIYRNTVNSFGEENLVEQVPVTTTSYKGVGVAGVNYFKVLLADTNGDTEHTELTASATITVAPPSTPSNIQSVLSGNNFTLYWDPIIAGYYPVDNINIYRRTSETQSFAEGQLVATLPPTATSYSGTEAYTSSNTPPSGSTVFSGDSVWYSIVVVSDTAGPLIANNDTYLSVYGPVPDVSADKITITADRLSYTIHYPNTLNGNDIAFVSVWRNTVPNRRYTAGSFESNLNLSTSSFTGTGVEGMNYITLRVSGNNDADTFITKSVFLTAADTITDVSASPTATASTMNASWSFNGANPTSYSVEWSTDGYTNSGVVASGLSGSSTTYSGAAPSGSYYVRVRAVRPGGDVVSDYVGPISVAASVQAVSLSPSQSVTQMAAALATTVSSIVTVESGATLAQALLANPSLETATAGTVVGVAAPILQVAASTIMDVSGFSTEEKVAKLTETVVALSQDTAVTTTQLMMAAVKTATVDSTLKSVLINAMSTANIGTAAPVELDSSEAEVIVQTIPNVDQSFAPASLLLQIATGANTIIAPETVDAAIYVMMPPNTPVVVAAGTGSVAVSYNPVSGQLTIDGIPKNVSDVVEIGGLTYTIRSKGSITFQRGGSSGGGGAVCFLGNAPVLTPAGYRRIDSLVAGDMVRTADGRDVAIQRVKHQRVVAPSVSVNPYVIPAGMFGATENLAISPRHCVSVPGRGMVEARELGLRQLSMKAAFDYYNLELPEWDNMVVAGVEVESLAPKKRVVMTAAEFRGLVAAQGLGRDLAKLADIAHVLADGRVEVALTRKARRLA